MCSLQLQVDTLLNEDSCVSGKQAYLYHQYLLCGKDPAVFKRHGELCPAMKTLMPKLLASGEQPPQIRGRVDNSDAHDKVHRKVRDGFLAMMCWVGGIVQNPAMLESMNVEEMLVEAGYYQRQEALKMTDDMCCVCTLNLVLSQLAVVVGTYTVGSSAKSKMRNNTSKSAICPGEHALMLRLSFYCGPISGSSMLTICPHLSKKSLFQMSGMAMP